MPSSKKPIKIKPSEVASDTKKRLIPEVSRRYQDRWPPYSYLYAQPLVDVPLAMRASIPQNLPTFTVYAGDPVNTAILWAESLGQQVPFICAANEKRPGGDWETGVVGYEERLCRRSNLSATLSTPHPETYTETNYPIPIEGAVYSPNVVLFRQNQDSIESLAVDEWTGFPVISVSPTRWPKLTDGGKRYSFAAERQLMQNKMRAALRICAHQEFKHVVIGDFGLGNGYRNPPRELAELWREVLLWDPELRGQFLNVAFVFEDEKQSTSKHIQEDIAKKTKGSGASKSRSKSTSSSSSSSSSHSSGASSSHHHHRSDLKIFKEVFDENEVARIRHQVDPRYGFATIMGGPG